MKYLNFTEKENYTIIQINHPKANVINFELVKEIRKAFKELEHDESVKGVILTGLPNFFSAGLDLIELYDYDKETMKDFFIAFSKMHVELARFTKPFICAITGHCPAGGTVIAIASDYRVMADGPQFTIGLNEVAVNVQISTKLIEAYSFWLGRSKAYQFIMDGKLLNPQEALAHGLVDAVVPMEDVLPTAEKKMKKFLEADEKILVNTKAKLRKSWIENIDKEQDLKDLEDAQERWWSDEIRAKMQLFVTYLQNKKKSKV